MRESTQKRATLFSFMALLAWTAFAASACFTSLDQQHWEQALRAQPVSAGDSRTYSAGLDQIIAAISAALTEAHFDPRLDCHPKVVNHFPDCGTLMLTRLDDSTEVIMATKTEHGFHSGWLGTQARLILREEGPLKTRVTIVSMYRQHRLLGRDDYAPRLFRTMDKQLGVRR